MVVNPNEVLKPAESRVRQYESSGHAASGFRASIKPSVERKWGDRCYKRCYTHLSLRQHTGQRSIPPYFAEWISEHPSRQNRNGNQATEQGRLKCEYDWRSRLTKDKGDALTKRSPFIK